jgi:hypothetical protein
LIRVRKGGDGRAGLGGVGKSDWEMALLLAMTANLLLARVTSDMGFRVLAQGWCTPFSGQNAVVAWLTTSGTIAVGTAIATAGKVTT